MKVELLEGSVRHTQHAEGTHRALDAQARYLSDNPQVALGYLEPTPIELFSEPYLNSELINSNRASPSPLVRTIFKELADKAAGNNGGSISFQDQAILLGQSRMRAERVHKLYLAEGRGHSLFEQKEKLISEYGEAQGMREFATLVRDCARVRTFASLDSRLHPDIESPVGTAGAQTLAAGRNRGGSQDVILSGPRALGFSSSASPLETGTGFIGLFLDTKKPIPPENAMRLEGVLRHTQPPDMTPQVAQALQAVDEVRNSHVRTVAAVLASTRGAIEAFVQSLAGGAARETFRHHAEESTGAGQSGLEARTVKSYTNIDKNLPEGATLRVEGGRVQPSRVAVSVSGPFAAAATNFEDNSGPSARAEVACGGGYAEGDFAAAAGGGRVEITAEFGGAIGPSVEFERE